MLEMAAAGLCARISISWGVLLEGAGKSLLLASDTGGRCE